jgi:hypothetical protein
MFLEQGGHDMDDEDRSGRDARIERIEAQIERIELKVVEIAVLMGADVDDLGLYEA